MPDTAARGLGAGVRLVPAHEPPLLDEARTLFREYAAWLGVDLSFQDFEAELAALPGKYAPPTGTVVVALDGDDTVLGCVAVRPLAEPGVCEMKRLWTRERARGRGLGLLLGRFAVAEGARLGYRVMRLDTVAHMTPALRLYDRLGFRRIPAYYHNPLPDVVYLERRLQDSA